MKNSTMMEGEGGDRKFAINGRNWRVRVKVKDEIAAQAPVNGEVILAPAIVGVSVSVAALDEHDAVAKDASGRLLVFDAHVLTLQGEQMTRDDFDPTAIIAKVIEDQIAQAEAKLSAHGKLTDTLSGWCDG